MMKVDKENKDGILHIRLSGYIDELFDFEKSIGPVSGSMRVNCKEIVRINSVGVKNWIRYFHGLKNKGVKIAYSDCSTTMVEQINLISNFLAGGEVESFYVPYSCTGCHSELIALFKANDVRGQHQKYLKIKCTKCGAPAVFDDIPEEYFGFLSR